MEKTREIKIIENEKKEKERIKNNKKEKEEKWIKL